MKRFHGNPTTRRFPRTSADAFAPDRFAAIEIYRRPSRLWRLLALLVLAASSLAMLTGWLS